MRQRDSQVRLKTVVFVWRLGGGDGGVVYRMRGKKGWKFGILDGGLTFRGWV